jgi:hypothetical protein
MWKKMSLGVYRVSANWHPSSTEISTSVDIINDVYATDQLKSTRYIGEVMENGRGEIFFFCDLFYDAVSISECTASSGSMTNESENVRKGSGRDLLLN